MKAVLVPPADIDDLVLLGVSVLVGETVEDIVADQVYTYERIAQDGAAGARVSDLWHPSDSVAALRDRVVVALRALVADTPRLAGWTEQVDVEPDEDEDEDDLALVTERAMPSGDQILDSVMADIANEAALFRDADRFRAVSLDTLAGGLDELGPDELGPDELGPDDLGPDERGNRLRRATLLAGCLMAAADLVVDHLFQDIEVLRRARDDDAVDIDDTMVLSDLPRRFAQGYNALFAQRFLVAFVDLTARLVRGWEPLACVAQELGLRILLNWVEVAADTAGVELEDNWRGMLEDLLFEDLDHEMLYAGWADGIEEDPSAGPPGMAPMRFDDWFTPFNPERAVPPYAQPDVRDEIPTDGDLST